MGLSMNRGPSRDPKLVLCGPQNGTPHVGKSQSVFSGNGGLETKAFDSDFAVNRSQFKATRRVSG